MDNIIAELKTLYPELLKGSKQLGAGNHGLIVDHGDGTLSKIFYSYSSDAGKVAATANIENEWHALNAFNGLRVPGLELPTAIGEITPLEKGGAVFAALRMTRLSGRRLVRMDDETSTAYAIDRGRALAKFHDAAAPLAALPFTRWSMPDFTADIPEVKSLDDEDRNKLNAAREIYREGAIPGIIHGDYNMPNILRDNTGAITGLCDFPFTRYCANILFDITHYNSLQMWPHVLAGYNAQSGRTISPDMLALTRIATIAHALNDQSQTIFHRSYRAAISVSLSSLNL